MSVAKTISYPALLKPIERPPAPQNRAIAFGFLILSFFTASAPAEARYFIASSQWLAPPLKPSTNLWKKGIFSNVTTG
jgi:hypothetical protein